MFSSFIQSGAKKRNFFNINFLKSIFIKTPLTIYQIKHNWIKFMMVTTVSKIMIKILYFFENDPQKTQVTKSVLFKENADSNFLK